MPGFFYQPMGRRRFLRASTKAVAAGCVAGALAPLLQAAPGADQSLRLALLADTHIPADPRDEYRKFFPTENLRAVVGQVLETRPEAAVIDGDAARLAGELQDYVALRDLLAPLAEQCPIYIGLGNHDDRQNFFKVFSPPADMAQPVSDKHVLVFEKPFVRLIVLDSLLYVNKVAGLLGKAQRAWLDQFLASSDARPTVLFVHHTLGDADGELLDVELLFKIVQPYRKVKAIFYGHSHQYHCRQRRGLHLINLPAVGYNFNDQEPVGWIDARFFPEGVDLTLSALAGNRDRHGQTTTLRWT